MDRDLRTERIVPLARRDRWAPALVVAALLVVLLMWLARRAPTERIVTVAAAPPTVRVVTVPVPVPVPVLVPIALPAPAPPAPVHAPLRATAKPVLAPAAAVVTPPTDVTARYREVGQLLGAHGTDALWQRYRWIRLGDCLTTDAKRAECVRMLDAIASDAAGQ